LGSHLNHTENKTDRHEVTPEWNGPAVEANGSGFTKEVKDELVSRTQAFHGLIPSSSVGKGKFVQHCRANMEAAKVTDHALKGGTGAMGLAHFQSGHDLQLKKHERRFTVTAEDLPPEITALMKGRELRSCIENTCTKDTRLEVEWTGDRQSLWLYADTGSVGWGKNHYTFYRWRVRGSEVLDILHRMVRNRICGFSFQLRMVFVEPREWEEADESRSSLHECVFGGHRDYERGSLNK
jgi:hypothetical protein